MAFCSYYLLRPVHRSLASVLQTISISTGQTRSIKTLSTCTNYFFRILVCSNSTVSSSPSDLAYFSGQGLFSTLEGGISALTLFFQRSRATFQRSDSFFSVHGHHFSTQALFSAFTGNFSALRHFFQRSWVSFQHSHSFFSVHGHHFSTQALFSAFMGIISALRHFFQRSWVSFQHSGTFFSVHGHHFSTHTLFSALVTIISAGTTKLRLGK